MRTLKLLFTFYKSFVFTSSIITLSSLSIVYVWGVDPLVLLIWFKAFTLGLIIYYINNFKKEYYYYYKNLGLSKIKLWVLTLSFDICLFLIGNILTLKYR